MQTPPQYSADGRFWWNGYQWVPAWLPGAPQRRSVAGYLVASIFIPGLGSLLLSRWRIGAIVMGAWLAAWLATLIVFLADAQSLFANLPAFRCINNVCTVPNFNGTLNVNVPTSFIVVIAVAGVVWLAAWVTGIVDAIRGTEEWNRTHGFG